MPHNTVVCLHPAACPWATHGYIPKFHHMVIVHKVPAGRFFYCRPNLPTNLRKNDQFDIIIFQLHYFPFFLHRYICKSIKAVIRINLCVRFRNWVRIRKRISSKYLFIFFNCWCIVLGTSKDTKEHKNSSKR